MIVAGMGQLTTAYIVQSITRDLFKSCLVISDLCPPDNRFPPATRRRKSRFLWRRWLRVLQVHLWQCGEALSFKAS